MKKTLSIVLTACILLFASACGRNDKSITVISREEGSGTRSAFTELTGVEEKGVDNTYARAEINASTAVVIQTVLGNKNAIGYISLGALGDSVKAISIDGIEISTQAVKDGSYPLARPFLLATADRPRAQVQDFLRYVLSDQGQEMIRNAGYVPVSSGSYEGSGLSGTVTVAGSSSVAPVMEKLAEAYMALNPNVSVRIQTSDSSTGLSSLAEGLCDIAMSSRGLKESETAVGIVPLTLCMDGIAVIVNLENPVSDLSVEQIGAIYTGDVMSWDEI